MKFLRTGDSACECIAGSEAERSKLTPGVSAFFIRFTEVPIQIMSTPRAGLI
jgi:hypothetical protein